MILIPHVFLKMLKNDNVTVFFVLLYFWNCNNHVTVVTNKYTSMYAWLSNPWKKKAVSLFLDKYGFLTQCVRHEAFNLWSRENPSLQNLYDDSYKLSILYLVKKTALRSSQGRKGKKLDCKEQIRKAVEAKFRMGRRRLSRTAAAVNSSIRTRVHFSLLSSS